VRFSADSVSGRDKKGLPVAFSLEQVAAMEVRKVNGVATALLVVIGIGVPIVLLVGAAIALANCQGC